MIFLKITDKSLKVIKIRNIFQHFFLCLFFNCRLNNKRHRERYKEHIYLNAKRTHTIPSVSENPNQEDGNKVLKKSIDNRYDTIHIEDVVSVSDNTNKKIVTVEDEDVVEVLEKVPQLNSFKSDMDVQSENQSDKIDEKNTNWKEKNIDLSREFKPVNEKV